MIVCATLLLAATVAAQAPAGAPAPDVTAYHLVSLRLGPAWQRDLPGAKQPGIREHAEYMTRLTNEGAIVLGGPFLVDPANGTVSGAMVLMATGDAAQARRWMEADPTVKSGLFEIVEVKRFMAATGAWRPWHKSQP